MIAVALAAVIHFAEFQPIASKMSGLYVGAQVHTTDGKDHLFLLDTGANESFVSEAIVGPQDKKHHESVVRLDVGGAQIYANAEPVEANKFSVMIGGEPTEGVLGLNLLKQIQLEIDYDAQTVRARYGGALTWAGPGYAPLLLGRDSDNLYTVAGKIAGKSVRLCVDTGATSMVIDSKKVDLSAFPKLPSSKIRTFSGVLDVDRYLVESMKLGEHDIPWMIASTQPWKTSDDGTIGCAQLGSSKLILDFPGSCAYVYKPDPISDAASRILGVPVRVDAETLKFRDGLTGNFKSSSGAKIIAIRRIAASSIVTALQGKGPESAKTLIDAFTAIRTLGLVATERGGERQLVPLQVMD